VPAGARPALVLLCVKSGATAQAAGEVAFSLPAGTTVVSLQNGISNSAAASQAGPSLNVLPGMVPYNVAEIGEGAFHRGTPGRLAAKDDAALRPWLPVFERAGVPLDLHADLLPVQWGKLLLNLNNPVNALSGLPLREELMHRGYRQCFAALIDETLGVLGVSGIVPAQVAAVPAQRLVQPAAAARLALSHRRGAHAAHRCQGALQHGRRPRARPPHRDRRAQRRGRAPRAGARPERAAQCAHGRAARGLAASGRSAGRHADCRTLSACSA
jgi:ketopantoate reductase